VPPQPVPFTHWLQVEESSANQTFGPPAMIDQWKCLAVVVTGRPFPPTSNGQVTKCIAEHPDREHALMHNKWPGLGGAGNLTTSEGLLSGPWSAKYPLPITYRVLSQPSQASVSSNTRKVTRAFLNPLSCIIHPYIVATQSARRWYPLLCRGWCLDQFSTLEPLTRNGSTRTLDGVRHAGRRTR
jgi:hypothetical protein